MKKRCSVQLYMLFLLFKEIINFSLRLRVFVADQFFLTSKLCAFASSWQNSFFSFS